MEKSTATQHATSSSSTATEHATFSSSNATEHATSSFLQDPAASIVQLGDNELDKIFALLLWMAQDFMMISNISADDIQEAALAAIVQQYDIQEAPIAAIVQQ